MPRKNSIPAERKTSVHVLFIGNSFTARNDLPGLVARMASTRGIDLQHRLISAGGASLRMHWNKGVALEAIRAERHDWVVLQEQSTLPIKNAARMHENIRLFNDAICGAGARTALYMTWARANAPAPRTQDDITNAYESIAREVGATVVPVGRAWQRFLREHDHPPLHDADLSHPTLAGSYLAACVFFARLFSSSPIGLDIGPVRGLSAIDLLSLQQAASATGAE